MLDDTLLVSTDDALGIDSDQKSFCGVDSQEGIDCCRWMHTAVMLGKKRPLEEQSGDSLPHFAREKASAIDNSSATNLGRFTICNFSQFTCQREIIKHIILESLINERIHSKRFALLPLACRKPFNTFFKECFGWTVPVSSLEAKQPSSVVIRHTFKQDMDGTEKTNLVEIHQVAFTVECYFYGVAAQVRKSPQLAKDHKMIHQVVYRALQSCKGEQISITFKEFAKAIKILRKYETTNNAKELITILPKAFFRKLESIETTTLQKYYRIKAKKYLCEAIDHCTSNDQIIKSFKSLPVKIDLLSNYLHGRHLQVNGKYKLLDV